MFVFLFVADKNKNNRRRGRFGARMTLPWRLRLLVGSWGIESCNSGDLWLPFV